MSEQTETSLQSKVRFVRPDMPPALGGDMHRIVLAFI